MKKNYLLYILLFLVLSSCSTRKNTFKNRKYHEMTSWFNTLFNGQEAMDKKLDDLSSSYQDDYFEILSIDPWNDFEVAESSTISNSIGNYNVPGQGVGGMNFGQNNKSSQISNASMLTGFEKAEDKALKAIANHSMVIKRKERNKLMSRAYLMLGQARYYQGKPFQALDALEYLKKLPFDKHQTEADYFMALSHIQAGNQYAAAEILDKLYNDKDLDKKIKANAAKQYAWLYYKQGDKISALNGFDKALDFIKNKKEEARINFIQGQILTELGRLDDANQKFDRAYRLKPSFEMEARSKTFAALNFDPLVHKYVDYKHNILKAYNTGTYAKYKNEFLYALGKIEEKRDSLQLAEEIYKNALIEEQSDARFRGETYAALADLKFNASDYIYAIAYLDSAIAAFPESERKLEATTFRSVLKDVMNKYYLVQKNDSILNLTKLNSEQQKEYFTQHIEQLKKSDAEMLADEQKIYSETTFITANSKGLGEDAFAGSNSGKFYFYSNAAKTSGMADFKKTWGNRRLSDNWRWSSAGEVSIEQQKAELTGNTSANNPRRYDVEFYIEQIPTDITAIQNLKLERDTVELALGLDYFDKLNNTKLATKTLEHLVKTPPKEKEVLAKAYYNLYRINKDKNPTLANRYRDLIFNEFPESTYAAFIKNPQANIIETSNPIALSTYEEAYLLYEKETYDDALKKLENIKSKFPNDEINSKALLLEAYISFKKSQVEDAEEILHDLYIRYHDTDEANKAEILLNRIANQKKKELQDSALEINDSIIKNKENYKDFPETISIEKDTKTPPQFSPGGPGGAPENP